MKRTSITDFAQDRDWTPPPTNKVALDVTLGAGDSVSFATRHADPHFDSDGVCICQCCTGHSTAPGCMCPTCSGDDDVATWCICTDCNVLACGLHEPVLSMTYDEKVDLARQFALPDVIEALWPGECACGEKIKPGEPMRAESYTRLGEPDEWHGRCCL